jgi:hypothetical protein
MPLPKFSASAIVGLPNRPSRVSGYLPVGGLRVERGSDFSYQMVLQPCSSSGKGSVQKGMTHRRPIGGGHQFLEEKETSRP